MSNKLWESASGPELNPIVEKYTVGDDVWLDAVLLGWDIKASIAHAKMLGQCGLLSKSETTALVAALKQLKAEWKKGSFVIKPGVEDGHSAIEAYVIEQVGDAGKKIHTARSRNDQSLVMMRLYMKDSLELVQRGLASVAYQLQQKSRATSAVPMPGYTHTQKAMPSTVSAWLMSYHDAFTDIQLLLEATHHYIDQNPLGSAAGYGVDLPIRRDLTTKALGFGKTQQNPLYCGMSRGLFEQSVVQAYALLMTVAGKFANDMILFTTEEFNFMSLPDEYTTGSSIMPHKRNYDVFEVMRAHAHMYSTYTGQIAAVATGVGSGYHRDYQLMKKPLYMATTILIETLDVLTATIPEIIMHSAALKKAITSDMQSVSEVNRLVRQGVAFRDAYQKVKERYQ
ncbi:argininosuccinate lyase [Candidatus Saccharibacteria bacterium]|nr:MAG: argininosuccinate lyase [Candidatus Saccharibacteria bacterium]